MTVSEAREAELIAQIARVLGHESEKGRVRAWCEGAREEFRAIRGEIGTTKKRDRLREVERTCMEAAKALRGGPPTSTGFGTLEFETLDDDAWLPKGGIVLNGVAVGSTGLLMLLGAAAEAAKMAAEKLKVPKARATPDKDATAHYAYMLAAEFPPRRKSLRVSVADTSDTTWHVKWKPRARPANVQLRSHAEFVAENWARLSPAYRAAYNGLQKARGLPPLLPPKEDSCVPLRRGGSEFQEPSRSPEGPLLKVAPLLFEYLTGQDPDGGLDRSCRKVLSHLHGPRGRKRRS